MGGGAVHLILEGRGAVAYVGGASASFTGGRSAVSYVGGARRCSLCGEGGLLFRSWKKS